MEIENDSPNTFMDFIIQSASFADCCREEIENVADLTNWLSRIGAIERVLIKDRNLSNYTWQRTFINIYK